MQSPRIQTHRLAERLPTQDQHERDCYCGSPTWIDATAVICTWSRRIIGRWTPDGVQAWEMVKQ